MRTNRHVTKHSAGETGYGRISAAVFEPERKQIQLTSEKWPANNRPVLERRNRLKDLVWSYHLTTVLTSDGRGIIILSVFDEYTDECLRCIAADHLAIENVLDVLFGVFLQRTVPKQLVAFDDDDLIPNAIREWLGELELGCTLVKSTENDGNRYGISAGGKLIRDLFQEKRFVSLGDVQSWLLNWRSEHNGSITPLYL